MNELKVEDIQTKINEQINQIRKECTDMCSKPPEQPEVNKFTRAVTEKDVEINCLKKDLESLQEHNERVWKGYEQDVENLRSKLEEQAQRNEELSSKLEITHTYKEKNSSELHVTQEEADRLKTKMMELQNEYNEDLRGFKEKIHKKDSLIKELTMDEDFIKSEHHKELKKLKNKSEAQLNNMRRETDLQTDLLKREVDKKDREVTRLKGEVDGLMELDREKVRTYEGKRHKHNMLLEKLQEQLHETQVDLQNSNIEKKHLEKRLNELQKQIDADDTNAGSTFHNDSNVIKTLHEKIVNLEDNKESLEKELKIVNSSKLNRSKPEAMTFDNHKENWNMHKRIEALEKYNNDLKTQLKRTTDALADKIKRNDVRQVRIAKDNSYQDTSPLRNFNNLNSDQPSFNNSVYSKTMLPFENSQAYTNISSFGTQPSGHPSMQIPRAAGAGGIKSKLDRLKHSVNSGML